MLIYKVYYICLLSIISLFVSCKKYDFPCPNNEKKCDYVQASATVFIPGDNYPLLLFKKEYNSLHRIEKITGSYRNTAGGIEEPGPY
jgi:hypothetical protein